MPHQTSVVSFLGGIDSRSDPLQLALGKLAVADNVSFIRPKEISTRYGYKAFPKLTSLGTAIKAGQALMAYGNELVLCDPLSLYSWDGTTDVWNYRAPFASIAVMKKPVVRNPNAQASQDENTAPNGLQVDAWEDSSGGVWYSCTDTSTGQCVVPPTVLDSTASKPKVLILGAWAAILYVKPALSSPSLICLASIPTAAPRTAPSVATVTNTVSVTALSTVYPNYDAMVMETAAGPQLYLAFNNNVSGASAGITIMSFGSAAPLWAAGLTPTVGAYYQNNGAVFQCLTSAGAASAPGPTQATPTDGGGNTYSYVGPVGNLTAPTKTVTLPSTAPRVIGVFADVTGPFNPNGGPAVAWSDGTHVFVWILDLNLNPFLPSMLVQAPFVIALTGISTSTTARVLSVLYSVLGSSPSQVFTRIATLTNTSLSDALLLRSVGLAGKAFKLTTASGSRCYVPLAYQSTSPSQLGYNGLQNTYFVADLSGNAVARMFCGTAGGLPSTSGLGAPLLPEVCQVSSTEYRVALLQTDLLSTVDTSPSPTSIPSSTTVLPGTTLAAGATAVYTQTGITSVSMDFFDPSTSYLRAVLANCLFVGGGFISQYDGQTVTELGFHLYPENINAAQDASPFQWVPGFTPVLGMLTQNTGNVYTCTVVGTGVTVGTGPAGQSFTSDANGNTWSYQYPADDGLTLLATYYYCVTYEWEDATGATHRSAPSIPFPVTLTGFNNQIVLTIPTLRITAKPGVRIMVYRSIATGTVYQQAITTVTAGSSGSANQPILNDPTVDSVTFTDNLSDADLQGNVQLYTTGGNVENLPIEPVSDLTVNYNRLFGLSPDGSVIWFSQQNLPGTPVQMSAWLSYNVDPRGGPVSEIQALDERLLLFKNTSIMRVEGIGPDATGGGANAFQDAVIIATDVGCIQARSKVLDPDGVFFQSEKGLAHIDRSLNVTPKGASVDGLVIGQTITSAQLVSYTQQLRFTLGNGTAILYDYFVNQWGSHSNVNAVDSCLWQGQFCYLRPDGTVMGETVGQFSDNGSFIPVTIETGWIRWADVAGWVRTLWVQVLSRVASPCTLVVSFAYDDDPTIQQRVVIPIAAPGAFGSGSPFGAPYGQPFGGVPSDVLRRAQPKQQRATSMKITLQTQQSGANVGEGLGFSALAFEYMGLGTLKKLGKGATFA